MDDPTCQRPIAVQERSYMGFSDHAYGTIRFEEICAEKSILAKMKGVGTGNAPRLVEDFCTVFPVLGQMLWIRPPKWHP